MRLFLFLFCVSLHAQTFTTLVRFDATDGANPNSALIQATDRDFYGTTGEGSGSIYKVSSTGTLTTLYNFCIQTGCPDGSGPGGLIQATDGNFYGTTSAGGSHVYGTVYKITPTGTLTTLYDFCAQTGCADGANPSSKLVEASDGNFYGTTSLGGVRGQFGTIFKITPGGDFTSLYSFCSRSECADGAGPSSLIQSANGDFYGTTGTGGAIKCLENEGCGTIFKITAAGVLTTLYDFNGADGQSPMAGVIQANDGNFYGTTYEGGTAGDGTVFKITPAGALTTLYSFSDIGSLAEYGSNPEAALIQGSDGNFYGTAQGGIAFNYDDCANGCGTLFRITSTGTLTTLHEFCSQTDCGSAPLAGLLQATSGVLYGTTKYGGGDSCNAGYGCGTLYSLSIGLKPFVELRTTSGSVGGVVQILGTDLTGATSVSFNGTAAVFTVVSSSLITANVPAGATSGRIQVVTPGGTESSNVPFRVLP